MSPRSGEQPAGGQPADDPAGARGSLPLVTVVCGEPTAAEIAALTVVVDALVRRSGRRAEPGRPAGSRWGARDQSMRPQLRPGPGAWRASALPR